MSEQNQSLDPYSRVGTYSEESGDLNVVIETPRRSRNKYVFDEELGLFRLTGVLPAGAFFPFDYGFVPCTVGGDGDPLDVLVLMDEEAFAGCLVPTRLIGVIEADQTEDGATTRNDRLIAVASVSRSHADLQSLDQINDNLMREIEHFFVSYNNVKDKEFAPLGRHGPERAGAIVEDGMRRYREQHSPGQQPPQERSGNGKEKVKSKGKERGK